MENLRSTSILANRKNGELKILWNDGHSSVYSLGLIQAACPCASCRGGHEKMSAEPDPLVFERRLPDSPAIHLKKIEPIGSYALVLNGKMDTVLGSLPGLT